MKTISKVIVLSLIFFFQVFAQEETLLGSNEVTHGGFGGPYLSDTLSGKTGVWDRSVFSDGR